MLDPQAPSCSVTAPVTLDFLEEDRQIQLAIQASLLGNSRGSRPKRETGTQHRKIDKKNQTRLMTSSTILGQQRILPD